MEGSRLILKRHVPRGRQKLAVLIGIGTLVSLVILVLQLKMTLSASALENVHDDVANMRADFDETSGALQKSFSDTETERADTAAKFEALIEAARKAQEEGTPAPDGEAQDAEETAPSTDATTLEQHSTPPPTTP